MYLREKLIKAIKVINAILTAAGLFNIFTSAYVIISLLTYYSDKIETALNAKAMPESVSAIIIGIIFLIVSGVSRHLIGDAFFYSSFFENDLDGSVNCSDLSEITGKSVFTVAAELRLFSFTIMKNYELKSQNGKNFIALKSKTYTCQCGSCGAPIEKSVYFTGKCSFCGSSDLFAKVITDDRFYCISNDTSDNRQKPSYYTQRNLSSKKGLFIVLLTLSFIFIAVLAIYTADCISNYNDEEYLREVLLSPDNHLFSYKLIKADILDSVIFSAAAILALIPVALSRIGKIKHISAAEICSEFFAKAKTPFIKANSLPDVSFSKSKKGKMKSIMASLRIGYLRSCTFEKNNDELMVALAKKIVKDKCPSCGAPITGAADEHYKCKYCDSLIMEVIRKK